MSLWLRICITILFVIFATIVFCSIPNRSNFPSSIVIPLLVALLTKYVLGDWDEGFRWTALDVVYWLTLIGVSYAVIDRLSLGRSAAS